MFPKFSAANYRGARGRKGNGRIQRKNEGKKGQRTKNKEKNYMFKMRNEFMNEEEAESKQEYSLENSVSTYATII